MSLGVLLLVLSSVPADKAQWALQWEAPGECVGGEALKSEVEERLGKKVFADGPLQFIEGQVRREKGHYQARITVADASGAIWGTRFLRSDNGSCSSLDKRAVLVVALLIDPTASIVLPTPPPLPVPPLPKADFSIAKVADSLKPNEAFVWAESNAANVSLIRILEEGGGTAPNGVSASFEATRSECVLPCKLTLPTDGEYFVSGKDIMPSNRFRLQPGGSLHLKVKAATVSTYFVGIMVAALGYVTATTGTLVMLAGIIESSNILGGAVLTALGAGLVVWGYVISLNAVTTVEFLPPSSPLSSAMPQRGL